MNDEIRMTEMTNAPTFNSVIPSEVEESLIDH
jgi:hypothetical protein